MPAPASPTAADWVSSALFVFIALWIYALQVRRIRRDGGKVLVEQFDLPELLMSFVFAGFFLFITISSVQYHGGDKAMPIKIESVLPNSMIFIIFVVGIAGFMRLRGVQLLRAFGFDRVSPFAVLGWACGLILAAFPLANAGQVLTQLLFPREIEPQPLVDLFSKMAREHDYSAMAKILVSAVIIAPTCEEFLFRGFFYGVWKRYIGPIAAGLIACLLFAGFHASLSAFAGLFLLAICLNIAYERTGSLFVPICMHALFNLTSLLVLYGQAQITTGK
ncbi:MAG TPA: CPBP family intramembrane glutamic endopeptidase [Chthoniobacter sp.]|nr:CPBP family intramembrane glutamic endopeptidase [Chthoniobacter sp.]